MGDIIYCYITNSSKEEAQKVARHLLNRKLIACANMFPISSMFWWKGEIEEGEEYVLLGKSLPEKYDRIKEEAGMVHEFETPCIIKISAQANESYYAWMKEEVN